jgi:hypothetical protein
MKASTLIKKVEKTRSSDHVHAGLDTLAQNSTLVMGGVSALIGIWAVSCFIGGLVSAGGPLKLAYSWFMAANGLQ